MTNLATYAERLDRAAFTVTATPQLTAENDGLTKADALEIQRLSMQLRYGRGERRIGIKLGLTSVAKMRQVGVDEVIWGRLTDAMVVADGGEVDLTGFIHPRVEPEIAFLLNRPLSADASLADAELAVEAVMPALEIIDSRYENFQFRLEDVIADNSSSSGVVFGAPGLARDIGNLGIVMAFNGRPAQFGSSAAILGHPLRALVAGARMAALAGEPLQAGDLVLAGAATAAEAMVLGTHVAADIQSLGRVSLTTKAGV